MTTISISVSVPGDPFPGEKEVAGKLFPSWLIAVMAGAAGLVVLAILVLCLCCLKCRRKKAKRGKKTLIAYYLVSVLCSLFMILLNLIGLKGFIIKAALSLIKETLL